MPLAVPAEAIEALRRSTAKIVAGDGPTSGCGSAVAVADGLLITNAHVVRGARRLYVESWHGEQSPGSVLKVDHVRDLALVAAAGFAAPPARIGKSDDVRPGMPVFAIGNPLGFSGALSSGVIHSLIVPERAMLPGLLNMQPWLCADVQLAPGNSGGPLADFQGRVVGVNTMVISGGLALAVPGQSVERFLLRNTNRRSLGVTVRILPATLPLPTSSDTPGILLLEIQSGGAAECSSLMPGDILITANGRTLRFAEDLEAAIAERDLLELTFTRAGDRARCRQVSVRLPPQLRADAA